MEFFMGLLLGLVVGFAIGCIIMSDGSTEI